MMATGKEFEVTEVGINTPKQLPVEELTVTCGLYYRKYQKC